MGQRGEQPTTSRDRVLSAAMGLFLLHGVSGTSLQMIADELGLTKAAVYYQFRSKEEIVWAVVAPALDELSRIVDEAERRRRRSERASVVVAGVVDLVVRYRRLTAIIQADPAVARLMWSRPDLRALEERANHLLMGPDPDAETVVRAVMVSGGLMMAGADPRLNGLDDDTLRDLLLENARRTLRLRPAGSSTPERHG